MSGSVPTVDDLRTKICYICREEEDADVAAASATWVHPCGACALIAHEECLLQWMRGAQQDAVHAAKALMCPQCGSAYDIESVGLRALALIRAGDRLLVAAGAATPVVAGFLAGGTILGSSAVSLGAYGPWALRTLGGADARRARIQNAQQAGSVAGVARALLDSSLGRDALGALAAPLCAAGVGSALLRLGRGSALVRAVLGVGAEAHGWGAGEPVWWRNALGLGVCVVVRDVLVLLHAWLEKRARETARVRCRPAPRTSSEAKRGSTA